MTKIYVISSASVIDGQLEVHSILTSGTYTEAIEKAQDSIAQDFGYDSWNDYLSHMDPKLTEKHGTYTIYDNNCGHEESYHIEAFTTI